MSAAVSRAGGPVGAAGPNRVLAAQTSATPPLLVVVTGPSGVGKDTVLAQLKARGSYHVAVTATTRPKRPGERDGVDYLFVRPWQFEHILSQGGFLENAVVYGHRYGVPKAPVREALARGQDVLVRTDIQGASFIKSHYPQAVVIFLAPPSWEELERRLRARASDDPQAIEARLAIARQEMAASGRFDYAVVNDRLEEAVAQIEAIIAQEKARPGRQPLPL